VDAAKQGEIHDATVYLKLAPGGKSKYRLRIERMSRMAERMARMVVALLAFHVVSSKGSVALGEVADRDVITPIALSIPDVKETDRVRRELARRPLPVFRFSPQLGEQSEARLRANFEHHRQKFVRLVEKSYGRRTLNRATVNHSGFARFVNGAAKEQGTFPLSVELAGAWALGETADTILDRWMLYLRKSMDRFICSEPVDETVRSAFDADTMLPKNGRVVTVRNLDARIDINAVARDGTHASIIDFRDLPRARAELISGYPAGKRVVATYLATFLQPNALLDIGLTRTWHEEQIASTVAHRRFRAGDIVVHKGDVVDEPIRLAIDAIDEHERLEARKLALAEARRELVAETAFLFWQRGHTFVTAVLGAAERAPWTIALAPCGMLALVVLVRRRLRRSASCSAVPATSYTVVINPDRPETVFLPVQSSSEPLMVQLAGERPLPRLEADAMSNWREQVLEAEQRAEDLLSRIRAGLAPELAKQMMDRLVQQLLAQRKALLATYAVAAENVTALERRFTGIHEQLKNQLREQEERASALQQQLATKDLENSELLRAVLDAQKKLTE
jgi:hypothetical protein